MPLAYVGVLQFNVGFGRRAKLGSLRLGNHAEQLWNGNSTEDAYDYNHNHQLDKSESLLFHRAPQQRFAMHKMSLKPDPIKIIN
jgi:hypothetical protein